MITAYQSEQNLSQAERFKKIAQEKGWIDPYGTPCDTRSYATKNINNVEERYRAWLNETLATGLENPSPTIVLRCLIQARGYIRKIETFGTPGVEYYDAFDMLKDRIESILPKEF